MSAATTTDGRRARGERSRRAVLEVAVQIASREGLEGLTIGKLASELGASKSSVFALFGSKEDLQLATLRAARDIIAERVAYPALATPDGLPRLRAIGDAWCDYFEDNPFEGGCFLCSASAEMDGRPGPVRDAVREIMREWLDFLTATAEAGRAAGELRDSLDPSALAFRLNALGMAANWQVQLFDETQGIEHCRAAWRAELDAAR